MSTSDRTDTTGHAEISDLERVADVMRASGDRFAHAVGRMLAHVAFDHRFGYCGYCQEGMPGGECPTAAYADHVAYTWLLGQL
jgi:hypothetical protein